jgi:hypothetical protein
MLNKNKHYLTNLNATSNLPTLLKFTMQEKTTKIARNCWDENKKFCISNGSRPK